MKKEIIHPIFLQLASTMEDTFWKYIYEDLSYGKCPYGIYIQNEYMCCFIKGKEYSYRIDENNEKCCEEIHHLLKHKAGILSEKEKIQQKEDFFKKKKTNDKKFINKKFLRENLIQNFVLKNGKKYDIRLENQKNLISFIYVAFLFKSITLQDVTFENDEIEKIDGIEFHPQKVMIKKKMFSNGNIQTPVEDDKKVNVLHLWNNFVQDILL
jgi:hypothetical protein